MFLSKKEDPLPAGAAATASIAQAVTISADTQRFGFWVLTGMTLPVRLFRPVVPARSTR